MISYGSLTVLKLCLCASAQQPHNDNDNMLMFSRYVYNVHILVKHVSMLY